MNTWKGLVGDWNCRFLRSAVANLFPLFFFLFFFLFLLSIISVESAATVKYVEHTKDNVHVKTGGTRQTGATSYLAELDSFLTKNKNVPPNTPTEDSKYANIRPTGNIALLVYATSDEQGFNDDYDHHHHYRDTHSPQHDSIASLPLMKYLVPGLMRTLPETSKPSASFEPRSMTDLWQLQKWNLTLDGTISLFVGYHKDDILLGQQQIQQDIKEALNLLLPQVNLVLVEVERDLKHNPPHVWSYLAATASRYRDILLPTSPPASPL